MIQTPRLLLRPADPGEWELVLAGTVVGLGHLKPTSGGVLEIDCSLDRPLWGNGLAGEATGALLRHAFNILGAPAVFALIDEENARGHALAARLGFLELAPKRLFLALPEKAGLHHVEIWVPTVAQARRTWGWLLEELGWTEYQTWDQGVSWRLGATYLVFEDSPARSARTHERLRPGLNHIALHAGTPDRVEELVKEGPEHGWRLMFADRHPYAGGPDHYAAYLENDDGYEVELVASSGQA